MTGSSRIPLQQVRSEVIRSATLVLLRLQAPYPKDIPPLRAIDSGEMGAAFSPSGKWGGALISSSIKDLFDPQPTITLGELAAIIATNDHALIGISSPSEKGDVVISAQELLGKFPDLRK